VLEQLISSCLRAAAWLTAGKRPWGVIGGVCGLFVVVAWLFARGHIVSRTYALEFIRGTLVEREAQFLNQPGNVGFEFLDLLVEPAQKGSLADPHFLARAWELQTALKALPASRETTSILSTLHQIARESFKKTLPETTDEVAAAFFLIESRLAPAVQRQLYFPRGVRISVSYGTDDSVELGRFCDTILALARRDFPDLKVSAFNKVPLYPQVDKYVREGKVSNVFVSQVGVALLCGLLLWWRNRRLSQVRLLPLWGGLVMSLPLFFATAVMGLVMWALHIPLDMSTASIGALAINAATDFSLYLAIAYQSTLQSCSRTEALRTAIGQEGRVIVADCLLNTCCFLPLVTSHFLPVRQLGWMMGVMLVACAGGTLILMAALLPHCVSRKEHSYANGFVFLHPGFGVDDLPFSGKCGTYGAGDYLPGAAAAHCSCGVYLRRDDRVPWREGQSFLFLRDGQAVGRSEPDRVGAY
jgi:predicted RND superfamily exporter protein